MYTFKLIGFIFQRLISLILPNLDITISRSIDSIDLLGFFSIALSTNNVTQ